jgi:cyclopropane-fatty-acyl-phospholipid synthase
VSAEATNALQRHGRVDAERTGAHAATDAECDRPLAAPARGRKNCAVTLAERLRRVVGDDLPVAVRCYDGTVLGPADATTAVVVRSPDALRRIVRSPGELGFSRAYVAGDLDIDGDVFEAFALRDRFASSRLGARDLAGVLRLAGPRAVRRLPPPPEEARLHGRRHSKPRDAAAIAHHYDLSNDFYRLLLGPSMTYSCAVWSQDTRTLEDAQWAKHELVSHKLALEPGMRLLDVGSGWGSMVLHAAREHGVQAVGVTISRNQHDLATKRVAEAGLADRTEARLQDYRDVDDGPYDAISSIGMFEHVGLARLGEYFTRLHALLRPGGRLLNHAIGRPAHQAKGRGRNATRANAFIDRYVFPDGELHELGTVVSAMQHAGFEVRHVESLREHYALTLRRWVDNLEQSWDEAVDEVGSARARVWRLYLAGSAIAFEGDRTQVHQVLATKTTGGVSGMPLRPYF